MAVSIATVLFMLFAMADSSSSSNGKRRKSDRTGDVVTHNARPLSKGVSLIQSGSRVMGSVAADLETDPFSDLDDDFDSDAAKASIANAGSAIGWEAMIDTTYWSAFCLDLIVFAAVMYLTRFFYSRREKTELKAKAATAHISSTSSSEGKREVDFTPLMKAANEGDETSWRLLLKEIPDIAFAQDFCGCTALHVAAHAGSLEMAQELLARGADVNAAEAWEETPLHVAARQGVVGICKLLLEHGAELNPVDSSERTPLLSAGHAGKGDTCAFLLENGGECGGVADNEVPAVLNSLLLARMIASPALK